jgi:two-component system, NtrC family, sensor kinase
VSAPDLLQNSADPLNTAHLKSLMKQIILGALGVYGAAAAESWGDWNRVLAVGCTCVAAMFFNWAVTAWMSPRVGFDRAEDIRVLPNIVAMVSVGFATRWSFIGMLFFPFTSAVVHGLHTRRSTIRLVVTLSTVSLIALMDGVHLPLLLGMLGLTFFWHVVAVGKVNFARVILEERQRNIAELAEAHAELVVAQQAATANEKLASIGLVASGVAHEINNPMSFITSNIVTLLEDLKADPRLSPELSEYRDDIIPNTLDGIKRVNGIVDDLRRFSRREPERPVSFDLGAELQAAVRIARTQLKSGQQLFLELQPTPRLRGLPRQLSQVALNLIINAIQAIGDDGEVHVALGIVDGEASLTVRDTGFGIPFEVQKQLFTPFVTTKTAGKGTGLGLAVAQKIVLEHGGRILVTTEVGLGTTFEVLLPPGDHALTSLPQPRPDLQPMLSHGLSVR